MNTTPTDLSVESIESVLVEKEAVLAKEQAMLEGLKDLLGRMGYELVPARTGKRRGSRAPGTPSSTPASAPSGSRGRGRPRKGATVAVAGGEPVSE